MTTEPASTSSQVAAGRKELRSSIVGLLVLLAVAALAARGVFTAFAHFPHVFGGIMALSALLSWRTAPRIQWMPRAAITAAILALAFLLPRIQARGARAKSEAYELRASTALVGNPAPSVPYAASLNLPGGGAGALEFGDRVVLLNFWATWCRPCVEEMPALERFWNENRDRGIDVYGVTKPYRRRDVAAELGNVEEFLARRNVTYPIVIGARDSSAHDAYQIASLPTSILIGPDARVVDFGAGIRGTLRLLELAREMAASGSLSQPADE